MSLLLYFDLFREYYNIQRYPCESKMYQYLRKFRDRFLCFAYPFEISQYQAYEKRSRSSASYVARSYDALITKKHTISCQTNVCQINR